MHQCKFTLLIVGVLAIAAVPYQQLHAQPWLEDGRSCFCLRDEQGQIISNCIGVQGKSDHYVTAICRGGTEQGDKPSELKVQPPWTPVRDGAPGCAPCRPQARKPQFVPREPE